MAEVVAKGDFTIPAEKLWEVVRDFGNVSWIPGIAECKLEGEGPGMFRVLTAGDGPPVRERLESVDDATLTLVYTIPEGIPFPVQNYHSTMKITPAGNGCQLEWTCRFEPDGVSDDEARAIVEGMYGTMMGWLKAGVGSD